MAEWNEREVSTGPVAAPLLWMARYESFFSPLIGAKRDEELRG